MNNVYPLIDRVRKAMKNAEKNGYDFSGMMPSEITDDLFDYDSDIEGERYSDVIAVVYIIQMNG